MTDNHGEIKTVDREAAPSGGNGFTFHYVESKDIRMFRSSCPAFFRQNEPFWRILAGCPDIYDTFPCFFYLTDRTGRIVSSLRAYPDTVHGNKRQFRWAWMGDLFTDEAFRGRGLGTVIAAKSREVLHRHGLPWAAVSANEAALRIYRRIGFTTPGYGPRLVMLKSPRPLLSPYCTLRGVVRVAERLAVPARSLLKALCLSAGRRSEGRYETIDPVRTKTDGPTHLEWDVRHSSTYFAGDTLLRVLWKIESSNLKEENRTSLHALGDKRSKEPLCYLVVRLKYQNEPLAGRYTNFYRMTLMDYGLFKNDPAIHESLAAYLMQLFWGSQAEVLDVMSTSAELGSALRRRGMIRVGKGESFVFSLPGSWAVGSDIGTMEAWHFTPFTGDAFTF